MSEARDPLTTSHATYIEQITSLTSKITPNSARLVQHLQAKHHPILRDFRIIDHEEHGVVTATISKKTDESKSVHDWHKPLFRYDQRGFIEPLRHPGWLIDKAFNNKLAEAPPVDLSAIDIGRVDFNDLAGTLPYGVGDEVDLIDEHRPEDWITIDPGDNMFPEGHKIKNIMQLERIIPLHKADLHHNYGYAANEAFMQHALAYLLDIDILERIQEANNILRSRLDPDAFQQAHRVKLSRDGTIAGYNRALALGSTLDKVNDHQPGVHELYRIIYDSELLRRRSKKTKTSTNETFLNMDDKVAIETVKFAIGSEITKGQWKHLTRMTPQAMRSLFASNWVSDIPLKLRKKPGWLLTKGPREYRYGIGHLGRHGGNGTKTRAYQQLLHLHELKLGIDSDNTDLELVEYITSYMDPFNQSSHRLNPAVAGAITEEERKRRKENHHTSLRGFFRAYGSSSKEERDAIQDDLNELADGRFGRLSLERFFRLVDDWLVDIRPVLDKNQLRAPLKWWNEQQKAWHEAQQRIPGVYRHGQQPLLDLSWDSPVMTAELRPRDVDGTARHVVAHALTDAKALQDEGRRMSHCVGSYARQCHSGGTLIFALEDPNGTPLATLELRNRDDKWVRGQCLARFNKQPAQYVKKAADRFVTVFNEEITRLTKEAEAQEEGAALHEHPPTSTEQPTAAAAA